MLKIEDFKKMEQRPDFLGFGYLGHADRNSETDEIVLNTLNEFNLDSSESFLYLNSKCGRWLLEGFSFTQDLKERQKIAQKSVAQFLPDLKKECADRN
jgi:hypothetical protein